MTAIEENPQSALILVRMQAAGQAGQILERMQGQGLLAAALVQRDESGALAFSSPEARLDSQTLQLSQAFQEQLDLHIPDEDLPPGQPGLLLLTDQLEGLSTTETLAGLASSIQLLPWSQGQWEALSNWTGFQVDDTSEEMAEGGLAGDEDFPGYS